MVRAISLLSRISLLHRPATRFFTGLRLETPIERMYIRDKFHNLYKMCSGLDDDGFRDEAIDIFLHYPKKGIKESNTIASILRGAKFCPDKVLSDYQQFLKDGLVPNAYTYAVVIKELAKSGRTLTEAKKYTLEMVEKGMRPNPATCVVVLGGLVREGKAEEGEQLLAKMREKDLMPEEKAVRKALKDCSGTMVEGVLNLLFGK